MNREQRRFERRAQTWKARQTRTKQRRNTTILPSRALWMVGLLTSLGILIGLWSVNTASGETAKKRTVFSASPAPVTIIPPSFAPNFIPSTPDTPSTGNVGIVNADNLKKGDTVWSNGHWLTVASVERKGTKAMPEPAPSPQPVLEADLHLDLSTSNAGKIFDVSRIAPCSQKVFRINGIATTIGRLKAGDYVCMTGGNIGRVVSIEKKWHTPTQPKYDAKGNGYNRVIATTKRMADRLLYLYTSVELIKTTPEHPFAVKGKGYVEAGRLQKGDVLETEDGQVVTVKRTEVRNESQLVYNLEVENAHNFFVGKNAMLVHNGGICVPGFAGEYLAGKAPMQVEPGINYLEGQYINDLGTVQPWEAHYDDFGRLIGRTDYNAGNIAAGIPDTHYHTYGYFGGRSSGTWMETGSHIPGIFIP